eukprot:jgi/Botrbrau1/16495/Bobra.0142s0089.1
MVQNRLPPGYPHSLRPSCDGSQGQATALLRGKGTHDRSVFYEGAHFLVCRG